MTKLTDIMHVITALAPDADRFNGDPSTDIISLKNAGSALFVVSIGTGATGTATITASSSDDVSGSSTTAIPFSYRRVAATGTSDVPGDRTAATASGFTTTAASDQKYLIEIQSADLPDDEPYVFLTLTEVVDSPVDASVECILFDLRYAGDTHITAIA